MSRHSSGADVAPDRHMHVGRRRPRLLGLVILLAAGRMAFADTAPPAGPTPAASALTPAETAPPDGAHLAISRRGLAGLDWGVVAVYAAGMVAVGVYYSRRQKSTEDYLLGGRRMRSSSIGLSLFSTLISTITYLALPGEMIRYGPVVLCYLIILPAVYPIVGYVLIPYFTRPQTQNNAFGDPVKLPVTSAYELLEGRLGLSARLLAAVIFLATRLVWMALIIYLTAKMLAVMLGWGEWTIPWISVVMGLVTLLYTWMGGIQAVVLTDVIQSYILFGGAVLSLIVITVSMGGVAAWWPNHWQPHWPEATWFSIKPGVRTSVIGSLVWMFVWWVCTAGSDQMAIQRYLATRNAKAARQAFLITLSANLVTNLTLGVLGFALLGFFTAHPGYLTGGPSFSRDTDYIFPYYIVNFLPVGAAGLVVAGVLAAAMSSLSSGINSSCSVIKRDFLDRFRRERLSSERQIPVAAHEPSAPAGAQPATSVLERTGGETGVGQVRSLSLVIGVVMVLASTVIDRVPGNIVEVTTRTNHLFVAPLFALFVMAMFAESPTAERRGWGALRSATAFGTLFGAAYGVFAAVLIGYWDLITGRSAISFQWISLVSLIVNLAVGIGLSRLGPRPGAASTLRARTIWTVICAAPMVLVVAGIVLWRGGLLNL